MLSIHLSMNENKAKRKKQGFFKNRWALDNDLKDIKLLFRIKTMDTRYNLDILYL